VRQTMKSVVVAKKATPQPVLDLWTEGWTILCDNSSWRQMVWLTDISTAQVKTAQVKIPFIVRCYVDHLQPMFPLTPNKRNGCFTSR
jgi:hypothetical protein